MAIATIAAPGAGTALPFDSVGAAQYPLSKITFGAEGASVPVADANGQRLPVLIGGTLPAGANNIGVVDLSAASLAALETVVVGGTVELGATTLAALETISIAGTVPVSAASLPLPTGASTEATLAALSAKLAALESGRAPVAVQPIATSTRAYGYAAGQRITTAGAGQVRSTAVTATEVLLHASVRGFFRVGDGTVNAAVSAGSIPLAADEKFHLQITSGQFVSFIRDGATDGSLTIMPVA